MPLKARAGQATNNATDGGTTQPAPIDWTEFWRELRATFYGAYLQALEHLERVNGPDGRPLPAPPKNPDAAQFTKAAGLFRELRKATSADGTTDVVAIARAIRLFQFAPEDAEVFELFLEDLKAGHFAT